MFFVKKKEEKRNNYFRIALAMFLDTTRDIIPRQRNEPREK